MSCSPPCLTYWCFGVAAGYSVSGTLSLIAVGATGFISTNLLQPSMGYIVYINSVCDSGHPDCSSYGNIEITNRELGLSCMLAVHIC